MTKLKQYFIGSALISSVFLFGQGSSFASASVSYSSSSHEFIGKSGSSPEEKTTFSAKEQLAFGIASMQTDPVLRNARWGFVVFDPKTNEVITSYNENTPLIPASTTKLLTTETAMSYLGSRFKWNTQLEYSGEIDSDGVLNGNLYIVGSGDPSLGSGRAGSSTYRDIITDFIYAIGDANITKIKGDIIIQTAVFKNNKVDLPANIVWLEHNNYFLPVGSTTNIDPRNEKLIVKKSSPFNNEKKYFYISPYNNKMVYADTFTGNSIEGKVPDAPQYLANSLRASMIKSGIVVEGKVVNKTYDPQPEERRKITSYQSPELEELVYFINQTSNNHFAENLLRTTGFYKNGDLSSETGRRTVTQHLNEKSYDFSGLSFADGSGLSRSNLVTPISQARFLSALTKEKYFDEYLKSLPIAGQTGTLKSSFSLSPAYGQIFAKTGTLNKVKTLSGYIKTRAGRLLAFSLLINNYNGSVNQIKRKMETILEPAIDL
ncbi:MAG: D-alanyl-D-alanine carboxypeptidase/D-alanyl-D-alanine-endopeptidase [Cloacibacterium sp.]|nr:D-alanyl-D-alanine carboxypeptidase/D-alanyl-D-alanine-endopeptidase [Cloacibacterium sp.]